MPWDTSGGVFATHSLRFMPENPLIHVRRAWPSHAVAFVRVMGEPGACANPMQLHRPSEALWRKRLYAHVHAMARLHPQLPAAAWPAA